MISTGEKRISQLLNEAQISYDREIKFPNLIGKKNVPLRFDFGIHIPYLVLIEFQGIQHYKYTSHFHSSRSDFLKSQERDRKKIRYCLTHYIPLYIIPAWEEENLNNYMDLFNPKFLATNQYHNDIIWREYQKNQIK